MSNNKESVEKFVELFLYYLDSKTLAIDLCNVLGIENMIKLIEVFGGTTIVVPSMKLLRRAYMNMDIYLTLSKSENAMIEKNNKKLKKDELISLGKLEEANEIHLDPIAESRHMQLKQELSHKYNVEVRDIESKYRDTKRIFHTEGLMVSYLKKIGLEYQSKNTDLDLENLLISELDYQVVDSNKYNAPNMLADKNRMDTVYKDIEDEPVSEDDTSSDEVIEESNDTQGQLLINSDPSVSETIQLN